jgi:hypothetical protein
MIFSWQSDDVAYRPYKRVNTNNLVVVVLIWFLFMVSWGRWMRAGGVGSFGNLENLSPFNFNFKQFFMIAG